MLPLGTITVLFSFHTCTFKANQILPVLLGFHVLHLGITALKNNVSPKIVVFSPLCKLATNAIIIEVYLQLGCTTFLRQGIDVLCLAPVLHFNVKEGVPSMTQRLK